MQTTQSASHRRVHFRQAEYIRVGGQAQELRCQNIFIGAMEEASFREHRIQLPQGTRLFVFSDGAYEIARPGGSMWSLEEFHAFLAALPPDGREMERVLAHIRSMGGQNVLADDFTMLTLRLGQETH